MKSLKERTEIQQAKLNGKQTEFIPIPTGRLHTWTDNNDDIFDWTEYDFRIKREPMEIWVSFGEDDFMLGASLNRKDLVAGYLSKRLAKFIELIE